MRVVWFDGSYAYSDLAAPGDAVEFGGTGEEARPGGLAPGIMGDAVDGMNGAAEGFVPVLPTAGLVAGPAGRFVCCGAGEAVLPVPAFEVAAEVDTTGGGRLDIAGEVLVFTGLGWFGAVANPAGWVGLLCAGPTWPVEVDIVGLEPPLANLGWYAAPRGLKAAPAPMLGILG